jgi:hypothetical protein
MDWARAGTVVLLDDSKRPEERAAMKAWEENLGDAVTVEQLPGFSKGMAAVVIHRPVRTKELWRHRFALTKKEIEAVVPAGSSVVIAGEAWWGEEVGLDRVVIPFMEHEGQYWGEPATDGEAIVELTNVRTRGHRYMVFGWPSFWWLQHYFLFSTHLRENSQKVLENDRLIMFKLDE